MKKLHRGPTILLTLVPALAAGLAIGLIINGVQQASQYKVTEDDKNYLAEINALMVYGTTYQAPHKVIMSLKNNGYDVLTHKFSNSNFELAFDASVKQFILMYGDRILATPDGYEMTNSQVVFKFTNSYDKDSKYGQYLLDDYYWNNPEEKFEIKASIDVGNNTNIKYMEYVPDNSNASATRLMRTYCEYLVFPNNNDTIFHMGESNNIEVYGSSSTAPCNYMEMGKTSYLYVQDTTLQVARINTADQAQIDVLEVSTGVTKGALFHPEFVTMLIGNEIEGVQELTPTEITIVENFDELKNALNDSTKYFIRIEDKQNPQKKISIELTEPFSITDRKCIIDLNKNNLVDKAESTEKDKPLITIQAKDDDSSLMFIDSWRQGEIVLDDHYIVIEGNVNNQEGSHKTATLYLEGANITYSSTQNRSGAIMVGNHSDSAGSWQRTSTGKQYSRVYMYGGAINCNTSSTTHSNEVAGIYAYNDALIQIYYGAIYSSINCVRTNGIYSGSIINISDGTFKVNDNVGECIYLPQGKLNISGGTFTGHTCIGLRGGDVNISGGYLHSTGEQQNYNKQDTGSGLGGDGSVICAKLCNGSGPNTYGSSLKINITNGTFQSKNSYILQVYRNDDGITPEVDNIDQYLDVTFVDGVYYYGHDVGDSQSEKEAGETMVYNGIRVSPSVTKLHYTINQNGGSWIKLS